MIKSDIVIFVILCIYLRMFRVSGGLSCVHVSGVFFIKVLNVAWSKALLT